MSATRTFSSFPRDARATPFVRDQRATRIAGPNSLVMGRTGPSTTRHARLYRRTRDAFPAALNPAAEHDAPCQKSHGETTMKRILIAATALSALAAPAFAADTNIGLEATVLEACTITSPVTAATAATTPIVLAIAADGKHTTALAGTTDAAGGLVSVAMTCNTTFTVDLSSEEGAVDFVGTAPAIIGGDFDNHIDYTATATFKNLRAASGVVGEPGFRPAVTQFTGTAAAPVNVLSAAAPASAGVSRLNVLQTGTGGTNSGGAYAGTFDISIVTKPTDNPLLEGTYDDVLTVTLKAS
jgi:hypothetical protein